MNNLISIIVPIYGVEEYLDKCVDSIVNQTYKNLEIILIDDGSPDNCPQKCDEWAVKDNRIKVFHKENGGLSDARNFGLKVADGDFIAFVDSDDWLEKNFIEYLYLAIKQTHADISACGVRKVPDGEDSKEILGPMPEVKICTPKEALGGLREDCTFRAVVWNKLYSSEILKNETFEIGRLHEDEFFSYHIFDKADSLAYIDIMLYNYRQRAGSIMTTFSVKHLDVLDAFLARVKLMEEKYPELAVHDKVMICKTCVFLFSNVLSKECDDKKAAKKKIKVCRKKLKFSFKEWNSYSIKDKIYVICSKSFLIGMFCKIKMLRGT